MEKKKNRAITIKDVEIDDYVEEKSKETGQTKTEILREMVRESMKNRQKKEIIPENLKETEVLQIKKSTPEKPEDSNEKLDILCELMSEFIEKTEATKTEETEKQISEAKAANEESTREALLELEEKIRSENFMLRFSSEQITLLGKLFLHRKEQGAKFSNKIEDMIAHIILYYLENSWFEPLPEGFKKEFKIVFSEFLDPQPETVSGEEKSDRSKEDTTAGPDPKPDPNKKSWTDVVWG